MMKDIFKNPTVRKFIFYALLIIFAIVMWHIIPCIPSTISNFCYSVRDFVKYDLCYPVEKSLNKKKPTNLLPELTGLYKDSDKSKFDISTARPIEDKGIKAFIKTKDKIIIRTFPSSWSISKIEQYLQEEFPQGKISFRLNDFLKEQ